MSKDLLNRLSRALSEPVCEAVQWKGREATRLANGVVEIICLTGGGHMASLRLLNEDGSHSEIQSRSGPTACRLAMVRSR
jgi:hypothetical protein